MKILYIVPYVPNLIRVRPYNLIRSLISRGHQVIVATVSTGPEDQRDIEQLEEAGAHVISAHLPTWRSLAKAVVALPQSAPMQSRYSWHASFSKQIADLIISENQNGRPFDVIHVEHLRGVDYGLRMLSNGGETLPPMVWDSVDCISYLLRQSRQYNNSFKSNVIAQLEYAKTAAYERQAVHQFDRVLVTSPVDRLELLELGSKDARNSNIDVLQNGVDLDYFSPGVGTRSSDTIVISGKMSYHANVAMVTHFINDIMPLVWSEKADVKVQIVGKDPTTSISKMAKNPNILVTGTVPDIRPYLQGAALAVAPITYGAGIQNKILEAMACATPVVTSTRAMSALLAKPGRDLVVAESASEFADAVLSLLNNARLQQEIGQAAREYIEKNHDWVKITARLEGIYLAAIHGKMMKLNTRQMPA